MLNLILLTIFVLLFAFLSWKNFSLSLAVFFFLLPTYLLRFQFDWLPTTILEIMFWIITIIWLIKYNWSIITKLKSLINRYKLLFIASTLFIIAATISIFTSINFQSALGEWKAFYVEPIIMFLILITTLEKEKINFIIYGLILSGLITSILAIYQHFTGWMVPYAFWENRGTYRVTAWYGFPNGVGLFLAPLIPLAIYLLKKSFLNLKDTSWKIKTNIWNWKFFIDSLIFIPCSILAIIYSKSTGALVGITGGIGLLLLLHKRTKCLTLIIGIVGVISLFFLPQLNNLKQEITFQDRSGQIRLFMWQDTWSFLKDNPINGAGLASYSEKIVPYHSLVNGEKIEIFHHPHNIFLTTWVNLGILGLISFIIITFYSLWFIPYSMYKQKKEISNATIYILSSLVIVLIMGLVDSPYIKNDLAFFFWLLPALLIVSQYDLENYPTKKTN